MKKLLATIGILLSCCVLFAGCESPDDHFQLGGMRRYITKEEYDKGFDHYEDELRVAKDAASIYVTGNVKSGMINLKIIENDKTGNAAQTYEYQITDILNETIEVDEKHSIDWTVTANYIENTEGSYEVTVFT